MSVCGALLAFICTMHRTSDSVFPISWHNHVLTLSRLLETSPPTRPSCSSPKLVLPPLYCGHRHGRRGTYQWHRKSMLSNESLVLIHCHPQVKVVTNFLLHAPPGEFDEVSLLREAVVKFFFEFYENFSQNGDHPPPRIVFVKSLFRFFTVNFATKQRK